MDILPLWLIFALLDPDPKIDPDLSVSGFKTPWYLKGLSHEIDFKTFDKNLQNLV
jgi:hypothetical protein